MNKLHKKRLLTILLLSLLLSSAFGLMLYALKKNINLFLTPTELLAMNVQQDKVIRIGGYVKSHSVHFNDNRFHFIVTDRRKEINIIFDGILPNLFREGQVVIVTGKRIAPGTLMANQVLAKHDENYMPKSLANKLKGPNLAS